MMNVFFFFVFSTINPDADVVCVLQCYCVLMFVLLLSALIKAGLSKAVFTVRLYMCGFCHCPWSELPGPDQSDRSSRCLQLCYNGSQRCCGALLVLLSLCGPM